MFEITSRISRRLSSTPAWSDLLVVIILSLLLFGLLYYLIKLGIQWQQGMDTRIEIAKSKRRNHGDNFRDENGYSWDVVFVFKVYGERERLTSQQSKWSLKRLLKELADGGLQTRLFYSVQADEVYCKVRAPLHRIKKEADRVNMKCKLDPEKLKALCKQGKTVDGKTYWGPLKIQDSCPETPLSPYDFMYVKYENDREDVDSLYTLYQSSEEYKATQFRGVDRLKLIFSILSARKSEGGCHLDIYRLMKDNCLLGFYPLHDHVELTKLQKNWLQMFQWPWNQPIDEIKDYFGEKIGLYFVWLGHYTSWLFIAAIIGFFCWINVAAEDNNPNAEIMPYFATFIAFWSTLFLEFWKRKEITTAMEWGTVGFEQEELPRPQFEGVKKPNPIDGRDYIYFPYSMKVRRLVESSMVISVFVIAVLGAVAGIFILKLVLTHMEELTQGGIGFGGIIASIANAVVIQVMNAIYGEVAIQLTDFENHRTDTAYEDSLITKTFIFQFVNSYSPLFYIAFVKPFISYLDPCLGSCMGELQTNLGTIFIMRLAVGNITEVGIPAFMMRMKAKEARKEKLELSEVEKAFEMKEYHVMLGPFEDYAEMAIQFGYTTMFVAAYPLATVMSFVNNYVEIRVDAWKLCQLSRRPEPRSAEDVGSWQPILEIMSTFAVLTNSALIAFTGTFAINTPWYGRAWIFFSMSFAIIGLNFIVSLLVPDVPSTTEIQLKRQEYIIGKVLNNIKDEDDDDYSGLSTDLDYTIRLTDDDPL
mmetsp:Transcript_21081/g.21777  ORF Transcript_21081/g.21777 Transcript_21081/m.21777 type:complete len:758 (+) Transcript_21081:44-2317(+)